MNELETLRKENAELREQLRKAMQPQWFYHPDYYEYCRFDPSEVIDDCDFGFGKHVVEVACAKPLPSIWCAVHVLTSIEKEQLKTDDDWLSVEFEAEAEALAYIGEVK